MALERGPSSGLLLPSLVLYITGVIDEPYRFYHTNALFFCRSFQLDYSVQKDFHLQVNEAVKHIRGRRSQSLLRPGVD